MSDIDDNDIAIVGMALRVPGATTPDEFWANLVAGVESLATYSDAELLERGVSAATLADPHYVRAGMPLPDMDQFDPEFFGFSPKEAAILDPQHRQLYEVAWEALERSGHPPSRFDGSIGVFAGSGMAGYFAHNILTNPDLVNSVGLFLLRHTGNDKDFLATRVSYAFDLKGPSVNVQTACSTSLVAAHLAVQSLLSRECDMALAGGVTIELPHRVGYHYREGEVLSPDGHCKTFDHRSKGTVFGSGAGVVVLRRLRDAIADGDHVHAVIKGSAINNDGSAKVGYLAPSVDGQAAAISEALVLSGVEVETLGYVECHGTGTPVGDPIEIAALSQAFRESTPREHFCFVGSVKTNIGHLDTAAGVASLIKVALAVEHGRIPASLHFEAPNPTIGFEGSPFKVADRTLPWPAEQTVRRAGVNSLGVGGTNAFIVLEAPPTITTHSPQGEAQPLILSARNRRALDEAAQRLAAWLRLHPDAPLSDVAWTLFNGRHAFEHRRVLAASAHEEAATLLENSDARRVFTHALELERPSVVFMYPGGGAQYFQMGRGLYSTEAVFREHMDRGFTLLASRHKTDLKPAFLAEENDRDATSELLAKPSAQLPLIFLIEYALTRLWEHYGVRPAAVIGHSMGENTAACIAGVFSFEDALALVLLRGQLVDEVPGGAMLSVQMPAAELAPLLGDRLDLATANSAQLSVASGPSALIDALAAELKDRGVDSQRVRINIAAHSRMLDGILGRFEQFLRGIELSEPTLPIVSNRTGDWLAPARARDPRYWVEHLRNTVLFAAGVDKLLESPDRVFLEVGPGNILGSFVRQNSQAPAQRVFSSLRHPEDPVGDDVYFRAVAARLWAVGVPINPQAIWDRPQRRIPLPTYPFQHASYWIAPGQARSGADDADSRPLRLDDQRDWFNVPRWVQQGIVESRDTTANWLVFRTREPVTDAVVKRLSDRGDNVVSVFSGDTFARLDEQTFTIAPEAGGAGYAELIEALGDSGFAPDHILHCWLLTWDESFRPGSTFFHRNQEYGFYSLFHLAQALGKAGALDAPLQIVVVGNGMLRVDAEPASTPDKATVLGPCLVLPREYPNVHCRLVDIALPPPAKSRQQRAGPQQQMAVVEALVGEAEGADGGGVFAWRDGVRWQRHVSRWKHRAEPEAAPLKRIRSGGVYVITGGLGGIAGVIAEWLARDFSARLVLLSRTPLPERGDWDEWLSQNSAADPISLSIERVRMLEVLGAEVMVMAADVTVAERMQEVVEEILRRFGNIHGVFHAAGVVRDSLIQLKSQREVEEVFSAKVYGTVVLEQVFARTPLDFMILFSSTSTFIAPQGQVDYVAANSFLNAFADARRGHGAYPIIAIDWGVWRGVGMVGATSAAETGSEAEFDANQVTAHAIEHPLFHLHVSAREKLESVHWFEGALNAAQNWVIDEHRLANGQGLLPGTGYLDLIAAALREVGMAPGWQLTNLLFQNPLFVADDSPRAFRLTLRGDERRWRIEIFAEALDSRDASRSWQVCASARAGSSSKALPAALDLASIDARCRQRVSVAGGSGALRTRQEDHLRFGPRWRVLKRIGFGDGEALARLQLPAAFADDLEHCSLHPGLLDIATGCAMDLIPGYAQQEVASHLWAPITYRGFRMHAPLTADLHSWIRLSKDSAPEKGFVAFDVLITDAEGRPLAEVEQLTLRRIEGALSTATAAAKPATTAEGTPVAARTRQLTPGELALQHNISQGIDSTSGVAALATALGAPDLPSTLIISSMPLPALIRQAENISQASSVSPDARFSRPELASDFEAPRDALETQLAELWGKLLGVAGVGIRDSFFDLGGHSLIAVRLFNEIADRFGVDLPMSVLLQSPTIAALSDLIRPSAGGLTETSSGTAAEGQASRAAALQYRYVVPMHNGPVADATPLFVVAGMFGNVLNLSHLAHLLGEDRPFYALQARGLYGDLAPHEDFVEAAADYLTEIRMVQPKGPYLLGGFSGGGILAYEMARQLIASGEEIQAIIMLDTPLRLDRNLSLADRLSMLAQGFRRGGLTFVREKVSERIAWEKSQRRQRFENLKEADSEGARFQSQRIGDAFIRALAVYQVVPAAVRVALFRPRLDVKFRLSRGRLVDGERNFVSPDNGWTPYVEMLDVHEVPGNHDSMVLEPNVRVLVSLLRRAIQRAQSDKPQS